MDVGAPSVMPRSATRPTSALAADHGWEHVVTALACQYEAFAIATGLVPTISSGLWKLPRSLRWPICVAAAGVLIYHVVFDAPHERRLHVS